MARVATQDFTLLRDDCRPLYFVVGQSIPVEYENHWFVLHHTDEVVEDGVDLTQADELPMKDSEQKRKPGRHAKA